jgi:hypothetical protein
MQGDLPTPPLDEVGDDALQSIPRHEHEELRKRVHWLACIDKLRQLCLGTKTNFKAKDNLRQTHSCEHKAHKQSTLVFATLHLLKHVAAPCYHPWCHETFRGQQVKGNSVQTRPIVASNKQIQDLSA